MSSQKMNSITLQIIRKMLTIISIRLIVIIIIAAAGSASLSDRTPQEVALQIQEVMIAALLAWQRV